MMKAVEFDAWRAGYAGMGRAEQVKFYRRLHRQHPDQNCGSVERAAEFLGRVSGTVGELGGFRGRVASAVLSENPKINRWVNYELTYWGCDCEDPRYLLSIGPFDARHDTIVAVHSAEHLTWTELRAVLSSPFASWVYIEAPLGSGPRDWSGHTAAHILEVGWDLISEHLSGIGYAPVFNEPANDGLARGWARN